jgi:phosphoribosylglycinamide formyltransferase-1
MAAQKHIAILISGRGSNMRALVEAARQPDYPARIGLVVSNRPDAPGLEWARDAGIKTLAIDHKGFASRAAYDDAVHAVLVAEGIELVALAGYMRIMTQAFVDRWQDRMLNIHPSLLPLFRGLHPQQQALDAGVRISGCTVHFVTPELDAGPIVAQAAVPVVEGDTAGSLEARILIAEHRLYPHALALVASGAARVENGRVVIAGVQGAPAAEILSPS